MSVRRNENESIRVYVEVDAIHHRPQLIVSRSKQRPADSVEQDRRTDGKGSSIALHLLLLRISVASLPNELILPILIPHDGGKILIVDLKR